MKCEIEFMPVGDASCAGDAIVIRYGDESFYELMLVDGGHATTGTEIVDHLQRHFPNSSALSHVVLTHSDADHASGLREVLKKITVENLWLHVPWENFDAALFAGGKSAVALKNSIKSEYDIIAEIIELAEAQGTTIYYPFAGAQIGPFLVTSPTEFAYQHLLAQFDKTPDPDEELIKERNMWLGKESMAKRIIEAVTAAVKNWTNETWDNERLQDGGATSASNESSVVLFGTFEKGPVLLTGDAGFQALSWSANYLESQQLPLQQFDFVQIPHHGSRRNVGPSILDRMLGAIVPQGSSHRFTAFVSAPADDAKHPRRIVTNAFKRRGANVVATQGSGKVHWGGFAPRTGYSSASSVPFYDLVEDYS